MHTPTSSDCAFVHGHFPHDQVYVIDWIHHMCVTYTVDKLPIQCFSRFGSQAESGRFAVRRVGATC
jgi:hypothetical protein